VAAVVAGRVAVALVTGAVVVAGAGGREELVAAELAVVDVEGVLDVAGVEEGAVAAVPEVGVEAGDAAGAAVPVLGLLATAAASARATGLAGTNVFARYLSQSESVPLAS
jgi:delta 1-pyrroline-5-carboxylate dehydrogenase